MNFTFHMTKESLQLVRALNEKLKKSQKGNDSGDIPEDEVGQAMERVCDEVQKFKQESQNKKKIVRSNND